MQPLILHVILVLNSACALHEDVDLGDLCDRSLNLVGNGCSRNRCRSVSQFGRAWSFENIQSSYLETVHGLKRYWVARVLQNPLLLAAHFP